MCLHFKINLVVLEVSFVKELPGAQQGRAGFSLQFHEVLILLSMLNDVDLLT